MLCLLTSIVLCYVLSFQHAWTWICMVNWCPWIVIAFVAVWSDDLNLPVNVCVRRKFTDQNNNNRVERVCAIRHSHMFVHRADAIFNCFAHSRLPCARWNYKQTTNWIGISELTRKITHTQYRPATDSFFYSFSPSKNIKVYFNEEEHK